MTKNSDAEAIRSMLAKYDPAADVPPGYHSIAAAEQIIGPPGVPGQPERDTGGTHGHRGAARRGNRPGRRYQQAGRPGRVAAGLAAAAIAAAVTAGLVVFSAGHRQAPTPIGAGRRSTGAAHPPAQARSGMPRLLAFRADTGPASERAAIAALTANAARLPGLGHGRFLYVRSRNWSIGTTAGGKNACTVFVTAERQQWIARDGSGRQASRTTSLTPGDACGTGEKLGSRDSRYGPGQLSLMYPKTLSSDPAMLRKQLNVGHPVSNGPAEFLVAVNDLYLEQPVPPTVAAAIVGLVSQEPGIHYDGTTTDRAGRPGIGFSLESSYSGLPTQYLVVFDAKTGQLLDSEQILNKRAGELNIPIPSVIGYDLYLKSGVTNHD
jgi:hypothetical protein